MKPFRSLILVCIICGNLVISGCGNGNSTNQVKNGIVLSAEQEEIIASGWYIPKVLPSGELSREYGIKGRYGQQDNYFDIEIGKGCDVAIKIMDALTNDCIRYVFVPENSSVNIQMIPQGKYYLKLAYGKDWMEYDNGNGSLSAKFTKSVTYHRSTDVFDFGKKNSSNVINYLLKINIIDVEPRNNFGTVEISEAEFMK